MYFDFLKQKDTNLSTYKRSIVNLFKRAGVKDSYIPTVNAVGYGQIASFNASIFANFPNLFKDHVSITLNMFDEAIGVYRSRIFETFNPFFWVECIIFLPKNILQYLGIDSEKVIVKIFQVIWWFAAPISIIFRDSIISFIKRLLLSTH